MDASVSFLGMPGLDAWLFAGLALTSFCTTYLSVVTGTAGGLSPCSR